LRNTLLLKNHSHPLDWILTMLQNLTQSLNFQTTALTLRAERQRLIASNIANADTPGYQAKDMDFASALRQATHGTDATTAVNANLRYARSSQTNLDGNTVDMDRERASFADNSVKYEATLRFINSQIKTLTSAITGQ
jgi:flagellar basal-body rod protein FlgB